MYHYAGTGIHCDTGAAKMAESPVKSSDTSESSSIDDDDEVTAADDEADDEVYRQTEEKEQAAQVDLSPAADSAAFLEDEDETLRMGGYLQEEEKLRLAEE